MMTMNDDNNEYNTNGDDKNDQPEFPASVPM